LTLRSRVQAGAKQDAVGLFKLVVGDYTNPILRPEPAGQFGEISLSGGIFPDPDSMCLHNPLPYILWNLLLSRCSLRKWIIDSAESRCSLLCQKRHPVAAIARPTYLRFLCPIGITVFQIGLYLRPSVMCVAIAKSGRG
jgi:hypothetical protein